MPGRHEAPGTSEFWQGLAIFATKIVVGLAVVFGLIFGVVKVLPSLFPSDDEPPVSITSLGDLETTTTTIDGVAQLRDSEFCQLDVSRIIATAASWANKMRG